LSLEERRDHVAVAVSRLCGIATEQPNTSAFLAAFVEEIQALEKAFFDLLWIRTLDNAAGVWLDRLGAIVGEPRFGKSDARYRVALRIKIRVNRSTGRTTDILDVVSILTDDFDYTEYANAVFHVQIGQFDGWELARWLRLARLHGVRGNVYFATDPEFATWDNGTWDDNTWGSVAEV
jgi:hypothetical protein